MRSSHVFSPILLRIDDVEDDSALRRGVPAAHHLYGVPQTINCANYVYFLALQELVKLNNPAMVKIYTGKYSTPP
jgi:geranylgeranyl diphosphate synthase type 3